MPTPSPSWLFLILLIFSTCASVSRPHIAPVTARFMPVTPRPEKSTPLINSPDLPFLHVQGRDILDANNQPILLRGVNMDTYYYSYIWDSNAPWIYATQLDIQYLKQLGANVIRLGLHWRYFETSLGYDLIDAYLNWCQQAGIYVILDMHVVPPEEDILEGLIWNDPSAQQQLINLWKAIADRYHSRAIIAGYDMYNEPAPPHADQWWDLAGRIVTAIRSVDPHHILFVENPLIEENSFRLLSDANIVYSFHDYNPFIVSHAGAEWVGDSPVPTDIAYPGPALNDTEWAGWSEEAAFYDGQTLDWKFWDSGVLTVPPGVEFATLKILADGQVGSAWFDELELTHNGVTQTLYNPGMEEASSANPTLHANWHFWSDSGFIGEWSIEQAKSGTHSLKIVSDEDGGFGVWTQTEWIFTRPLFRVQAGDTFHVRGWFYAPENEGSLSLGLDYLNGAYEYYDRSRLVADLQPFLDWGTANNVPLQVGEFGAMPNAPGESRWNLITDKISVMNEAGLHWALWTYRDSDPQQPSFGLFHGDELDTRLEQILRKGLDNDFQVFFPLIAKDYPPMVTFTPSNADIPNPERGFYNWPDEFTAEALADYASQGYTLAYDRELLNPSADLSPDDLNTIASHLQLARGAGLKFILRFAYNEGPSYPNPDPEASLEQVLRHIEQLAPILEANKDVIAWLEAGFIGAWGEWHTSANRLDTDENKAIIRDAVFAHFPADRFILFRYPADFTRWYPQPLTEAQSFGASAQARMGHHNDCFLASEDDFGTYLLPPDYEINMREQWQAYIAQMTRFVPMSGETCNPNPPRSSCPTALQEMAMLHWSAQNEGWHPDVIQGWKDQGCYAEIRNRLGYRLMLLSAIFSPAAQRGSTLPLTVNLQNTGFASPLLARPVYLVLVNQSGSAIYMQNLLIDPRRWEPGQHTFTANFSIPENIPAGDYSLALWLPDPANVLRSDPRYAIRFANENVWNAEHGWNILGVITLHE
ncbi:MAG: DUF4832 domain-containing protein [Chloroflexota bacterium]